MTAFLYLFEGFEMFEKFEGLQYFEIFLSISNYFPNGFVLRLEHFKHFKHFKLHKHFKHFFIA